MLTAKRQERRFIEEKDKLWVYVPGVWDNKKAEKINYLTLKGN
jgi:hypothetical protein